MAFTSALNLISPQLRADLIENRTYFDQAMFANIPVISVDNAVRTDRRYESYLSGYRIEAITDPGLRPLRTNIEPIEVLPRSALEFRPEDYIQMNGWQAALSVDTELERDRIRASLIDQVKKIEEEIKLACSDQYFVV